MLWTSISPSHSATRSRISEVRHASREDSNQSRAGRSRAPRFRLRRRSKRQRPSGRRDHTVLEPTISGTSGTILIVGAIGDFGKYVAADENGTPDPNGNYLKAILQKGTFEVNVTALADNHKTPYKATCSGIFTGTAPGAVLNGTGLYAGIKGTMRVSQTHDEAAHGLVLAGWASSCPPKPLTTAHRRGKQSTRALASPPSPTSGGLSPFASLALFALERACQRQPLTAFACVEALVHNSRSPPGTKPPTRLCCQPFCSKHRSEGTAPSGIACRWLSRKPSTSAGADTDAREITATRLHLRPHLGSDDERPAERRTLSQLWNPPAHAQSARGSRSTSIADSSQLSKVHRTVLGGQRGLRLFVLYGMDAGR